MALHKVPGSRVYLSDDSGLKDLGSSSAVGAATLAAAQRLAGNAQAVGRSEYEARPATVTVGWKNERRAGAVVRESRADWRDTRDAILLRVADSMRVRGK
jgi:hypothetical protein